MKSLLLVTVFLAYGIFHPSPMQQEKTVEKKYKVEFITSEWQNKIQTLENAKEIMRSSNMKGAVIAQWQDSLTSLENEINMQISAQIKAETPPPVPKTDTPTTKNKKP